MKNIRLLDCTLRDGGYLNDWEFGQNNLVSIYQRLVAASVDIIEVGFIDDRRPFDINRSIFPDTASIEKIYGNIEPKAKMTVGMIDYGTCSLDNIQPCSESMLDGIRVIFKKHLMNEAMEYCAALKEKGYKVFSNLVSVADYSDEELIKLSKLVNEVKPYAVSMVDTYGILYPKDVLHIFNVLDENVDKDINIGFHAHNNLQLGFASCIELMDYESDRNIILDATLFGMGKSAGNDPIELVANYMNEHHGKCYDISHMLDAIEESVADLYQKYSWGYKTYFYLCSKNNCHPTYVGFFRDKNNLSVGDIDEILSRIEPAEKKLFFDRELSEKLYQDYIEEKYSDDNVVKALGEELKNKTVLLFGPGKNVVLQHDKVEQFIEKEKPVMMSINYLPKSWQMDYVFITKINRYLDLAAGLLENENIKIVASSNVSSKRLNFDYVINREKVLERDHDIIDNSFLMLLKVLIKAGVKKVFCAGFDGYSDRGDNYFNEKMEYQFVRTQAENLNIQVRNALERMGKDIEVEFVTYSHYTENRDGE